jgi:hypothetical protein
MHWAIQNQLRVVIPMSEAIRAADKNVELLLLMSQLFENKQYSIFVDDLRKLSKNRIVVSEVLCTTYHFVRFVKVGVFLV